VLCADVLKRAVARGEKAKKSEERAAPQCCTIFRSRALLWMAPHALRCEEEMREA